jgi:ATP phosphoribosyltransferase regulatory subunit
MKEPLSKIPSGMRYYSGVEARLRRAVEDTGMRVLHGWSYEEISTPLVDYFALFELGMGTEEANRSFRFADSDGSLLALRPDMTSLVARASSTLFARRERPLRFSYAAPVFYQHPRSHADWRRENMQLGCELIGSSEGAAEIEMVAIMLEILDGVGLGDHVILTLNNVGVFNGIAENLRMDESARDRMKMLISLRDSAELERFLRGYTTSERECREFASLTQMSGKGIILTEARKVIDNSRSVVALDSLDALWSTLEAIGLSSRCFIDLGDVSGLDYYTGMVFKIYVEGAGSKIGSGGRYDSLISNFGKPEPAIGFVLDLDAITEVIFRGRTASPDSSSSAFRQISGNENSELFQRAIDARARGERVRIEQGDEAK